MFERTDEDVAAGVIRLSLGGQAYVLPTLSWEASEEWQATMHSTVTTLAGRQVPDVDSAVELLAGAMGSIVDLVAAYDRDHKLGRDAADLKTRFDRSQMYEIFKTIARHEYPFIKDAEGTAKVLMPYLRPILMDVIGAVASRQPSTSNGRSPTGDSTPELSVVGSTSDSSSSSGKPAKSA